MRRFYHALIGVVAVIAVLAVLDVYVTLYMPRVSIGWIGFTYCGPARARTVFNKTIPGLEAVRLHVSGMELLVEGGSGGRVSVRVVNRGGCIGVGVEEQHGALIVKGEGHGCCTLEVSLPSRIRKLDIVAKSASVKLTGINADELSVRVDAASASLRGLRAARLVLDASAASIHAYAYVEDSAYIRVKASSIHLVLGNTATRVELAPPFTASSIRTTCRPGSSPLVLVSATAASVSIGCGG